ncbi:MAG: hypothetical protein V1821_02060 [bacterium]
MRNLCWVEFWRLDVHDAHGSLLWSIPVNVQAWVDSDGNNRCHVWLAGQPGWSVERQPGQGSFWRLYHTGYACPEHPEACRQTEFWVGVVQDESSETRVGIVALEPHTMVSNTVTETVVLLERSL